MNIKKITAYALCASLIGANAFAAGFQLRYQSAEAMGTGFSSAGTSGQALSQTYFNPASFMLMQRADEKKSSFAVEGLLVLPLSSEATTDGTGVETDGFANTAFAPSIFYGRMLNEQTALTVSLTTPWATGTDYDNDWDGRYQALETSLQSFNLTPAISRKLMSDKLILSGGLQIQYLTGVLSSAVDGSNGASVGNFDVKAEFSGDSLDFGLTLGATYLLSEKTTIAFNYISAISNKLEGDLKFSTITAPGAPPNEDNASLRIKTPDIISLGLSHILSEKLTLHTSANIQTWSSFEELETKVNGTATAGGPIPQDWDNSFFLSGGATFHTNEALTLRTGFFYESGAPGDLRSPRTVDADKLALAFGGSYTLSNGLKIDAAWNQIFYVEDIEVDLPARNPTQQAYAGEIENQISLLRVGVTYNW